MKIIYLLSIALLIVSCGNNEAQNESNTAPPQDDTSEVIIEAEEDTLLAFIEEIETDSNYAFFEFIDNEVKMGFRNKEGHRIIRAKFDLAEDFYGDYAPVIRDNVHGFCDTNGVIVHKLKGCKFSIFYNELSGESFFEGTEDGRFMVVDKKGRYGFVNNKAEPIIPCMYENAWEYKEGKSAVTKNGKVGYIDTSGAIIIPYKFEDGYSFSEGLAAVQINNKIGYIDISGTLVIPAVYVFGWGFSEGFAIVSKTDDYGHNYYIDKTGTNVFDRTYEECSPFENGEAVIFKRGKCRVIDTKGNQLRVLDYDYFGGC